MCPSSLPEACLEPPETRKIRSVTLGPDQTPDIGSTTQPRPGPVLDPEQSSLQKATAQNAKICFTKSWNVWQNVNIKGECNDLQFSQTHFIPSGTYINQKSLYEEILKCFRKIR